MALTLYGFHDFPNDFAVTKIDAELDDCSFLLDFSRPLQRTRWLGIPNKWIGPTVALGVPIVHHAEQQGSFIIYVGASDPYFSDLQTLWKKHSGRKRDVISPPVGSIDIVADFGRHFPEGR